MKQKFLSGRFFSSRFVLSGLSLVGTTLAVLFLGGCMTRPRMQTVPEVDISRYGGKWYEVARYPNWFQRNCSGESTADYTPLKDGKIRVVNRCKTADAIWKQVQGTARIVPRSGGARLKVNFGGPFSGDYWIIGLDTEKYQWAVVGHPSRRFLWFLARDPTVEPATLEKMMLLAESQGYRRDRLLVH